MTMGRPRTNGSRKAKAQRKRLRKKARKAAQNEGNAEVSLNSAMIRPEVQEPADRPETDQDTGETDGD